MLKGAGLWWHIDNSPMSSGSALTLKGAGLWRHIDSSGASSSSALLHIPCRLLIGFSVFWPLSSRCDDICSIFSRLLGSRTSLRTGQERTGTGCSGTSCLEAKPQIKEDLETTEWDPPSRCPPEVGECTVLPPDMNLALKTSSEEQKVEILIPNHDQPMSPTLSF